MMLRPLWTWQRWMAAATPKVFRIALLSAFAPSTMNSRGSVGSSPLARRLSIKAWTTTVFSVAALDHGQDMLVELPSMPIAAIRTWSPTCRPSIWMTSRSSSERSEASQAFIFLRDSATKRRETADLRGAVATRFRQVSLSGRRTARWYLRVDTFSTIRLSAHSSSRLPSRSASPTLRSPLCPPGHEPVAGPTLPPELCVLPQRIMAITVANPRKRSRPTDRPRPEDKTDPR